MKSLCTETREEALLTATKEKHVQQWRPRAAKSKFKKKKIITMDSKFNDKDITHCSGGGSI